MIKFVNIFVTFRCEDWRAYSCVSFQTFWMEGIVSILPGLTDIQQAFAKCMCWEQTHVNVGIKSQEMSLSFWLWMRLFISHLFLFFYVGRVIFNWFTSKKCLSYYFVIDCCYLLRSMQMLSKPFKIPPSRRGLGVTISLIKNVVSLTSSAVWKGCTYSNLSWLRSHISKSVVYLEYDVDHQYQSIYLVRLSLSYIIITISISLMRKLFDKVEAAILANECNYILVNMIKYLCQISSVCGFSVWLTWIHTVDKHRAHYRINEKRICTQRPGVMYKRYTVIAISRQTSNKRIRQLPISQCARLHFQQISYHVQPSTTRYNLLNKSLHPLFGSK